jgi:hypothetical protein
MAEYERRRRRRGKVEFFLQDLDGKDDLLW